MEADAKGLGNRVGISIPISLPHPCFPCRYGTQLHKRRWSVRRICRRCKAFAVMPRGGYCSVLWHC